MSGLTIGLSAAALGVVPLAAVALHGRRLQGGWWWLAVAFGVSVVADVASLRWGHPLISQTYPLLQGGLFAMALAPRPVAVGVVAVLAAASGASLAWRGAAGLDTLLHLLAWGSTAMLAWLALAPSLVRAALAWGFTALAVAWLVFVAWPTWWTWGAMQGVRLVTAGAFAVAAWRAARPVEA